MTLGSEQGVTDICGSADANLIARQLVIARAHLASTLAVDGLTMPTANTLLSHAVDLLASSFIASKPGAVDPRTNYEVDGFKRKDALTSQIAEYADQATAIVAEYAATNAAAVPLPKSTTS